MGDNANRQSFVAGGWLYRKTGIFAISRFNRFEASQPS
jgi:hypothetical protein